MEKKSILNGNKLESVRNIDKLGEKIDSLWGKSDSVKKTKPESKKLKVKLETNGPEKRKLLLKLESGTSKIHGDNYALISELLKDFFRVDEE